MGSMIPEEELLKRVNKSARCLCVSTRRLNNEVSLMGNKSRKNPSQVSQKHSKSNELRHNQCLTIEKENRLIRLDVESPALLLFRRSRILFLRLIIHRRRHCRLPGPLPSSISHQPMVGLSPGHMKSSSRPPPQRSRAAGSRRQRRKPLRRNHNSSSLQNMHISPIHAEEKKESIMLFSSLNYSMMS